MELINTQLKTPKLGATISLCLSSLSPSQRIESEKLFCWREGLGQCGGGATQLPWMPQCLFLLGVLKPQRGGCSQFVMLRGTSAWCCWAVCSPGEPRLEIGIHTSRSLEDLKALLWLSQLSRGRFLAEPSTPLALVHLRWREMSFALQEGEMQTFCP